MLTRSPTPTPTPAGKKLVPLLTWEFEDPLYLLGSPGSSHPTLLKAWSLPYYPLRSHLILPLLPSDSSLHVMTPK